MAQTKQPDGAELTVFIAEHYLPLGGRQQLLERAARLRQRAARGTKPGASVRYLGGAFVPQDETCFLLFEGRAPVDVERLLAQEEILCQRIVEATCLPAGRERA